jgi:hypothetical protein
MTLVVGVLAGVLVAAAVLVAYRQGVSAFIHGG